MCFKDWGIVHVLKTVVLYSVCVCVCVCVVCVCVWCIYSFYLLGDNDKLQYLRFCLLKWMLIWFLS